MPQVQANAKNTIPSRELWLKNLWIPVLVVLVLAATPLVTSSRATLNLLTQIFILGMFAASYDILLGYTGIVSFGHALFFGTGAYLSALVIKYSQPTMTNLLLAIICTLVFSVLLSLVIGYLSLRVRDVYYAMITLAFAELFFIIAEKWRNVTNGADGFSFRVPPVLADRVVYYYLTLVLTLVTVVLLRRFIQSPAGRVLVAIRENEQRAECLGYDVLKFKVLSNVVAGVVASLSGVAWALQQRFVSTGVMAADKTIDALLMTTIGGTGTLYGAFIGSGLTNLIREWLPDLTRISPLFEHWYIIFGLIYILIVLFFPGGIWGAIGKLVVRKRTGR